MGWWCGLLAALAVKLGGGKQLGSCWGLLYSRWGEGSCEFQDVRDAIRLERLVMRRGVVIFRLVVVDYHWEGGEIDLGVLDLVWVV